MQQSTSFHALVQDSFSCFALRLTLVERHDVMLRQAKEMTMIPESLFVVPALMSQGLR